MKKLSSLLLPIVIYYVIGLIIFFYKVVPVSALKGNREYLWWMIAVGFLISAFRIDWSSDSFGKEREKQMSTAASVCFVVFAVMALSGVWQLFS